MVRLQGRIFKKEKKEMKSDHVKYFFSSQVCKYDLVWWWLFLRFKCIKLVRERVKCRFKFESPIQILPESWTWNRWFKFVPGVGSFPTHRKFINFGPWFDSYIDCYNFGERKWGGEIPAHLCFISPRVEKGDYDTYVPLFLIIRYNKSKEKHRRWYVTRKMD